jgi:hypothetical protein
LSRWSPDGRRVETGHWSDWATGSIGFPTWSPDGTYLYYQDQDTVIHRLGLQDGRTQRVASRKTVPVAPVFPGAWFGFDPEGRLTAEDLPAWHSECRMGSVSPSTATAGARSTSSGCRARPQ